MQSIHLCALFVATLVSVPGTERYASVVVGHVERRTIVFGVRLTAGVLRWPDTGRLGI
jgi:hypothetical protein